MKKKNLIYSFKKVIEFNGKNQTYHVELYFDESNTYHVSFKYPTMDKAKTYATDDSSAATLFYIKKLFFFIFHDLMLCLNRV